VFWPSTWDQQYGVPVLPFASERAPEDIYRTFAQTVTVSGFATSSDCENAIIKPQWPRANGLIGDASIVILVADLKI
jgi:hypothetical protein